jgi:hypothetical protein
VSGDAQVGWVMLHRLWSLCVGEPGYDKKYWIRMEREYLTANPWHWKARHAERLR